VSNGTNDRSGNVRFWSIASFFDAAASLALRNQSGWTRSLGDTRASQPQHDQQSIDRQIAAEREARKRLLIELYNEALAKDNPQEGTEALANLEHFLRLEPNYAPARELKQKIEAYYPRQSETNSLGQFLVEIRPGRFEMGSPRSEVGRDANETIHPVFLTKTVRFSAHEVTRGQFAQFIAAVGHVTDAERLKRPQTWRDPGFEQSDAHPVTCVSWNDAEAFCQWLSQKERRRYRLPTEAEWEFACRAHNWGAYPWGDDPAAGGGWANVADQGSRESLKVNALFSWSDGATATAPVGSYRKSPFGLFDLVGNVREWCSDWYGPYPTLRSEDPTGPASGTLRVVRGGSYRSGPRDCRSAARGALFGEESAADLGFRIVLERDAPE
jgi:formylglycine-generating enzyme required for sulfatase activity